MKPSMRVSGALVLAAGLAPALIGAKPASAATWTLRDFHATSCVAADLENGSYYFAQVLGTWTSTITIGIDGLPPGSSSSGASIPAGSNDPDRPGGPLVNGWVTFMVPPTPAGVYHPEVTATDGVETESVPVTLEVGGDC